MAILDDIEVTIQVNGQDLREYFDQDGDPSTDVSVSKYIEAVSGARFEVVIMVPKSHKFLSDALTFRVFLDGSLVGKSGINKIKVLKDKSNFYKKSIKGVSKPVGSGWEMRSFQFTEINISQYRGNDTTSSTKSYS